MNLEELKTAWTAYDHQLKTSQQIQEKLITSMITSRSASRFSTVRKKYVLGMSWMALCLSAGLVVIATNPFDYHSLLQFVPIALHSLCLLVLLMGMLKGYLRLQTITIEKETLDASLRNIIHEYERPQQLMKYTLITLLFTAVVLFPLSFLPAHISRMGMGVAIAERLIPIALSALLLFVAYKLGAFRERNAPRFKEDLTELEQLKALSMELRAD